MMGLKIPEMGLDSITLMRTNFPVTSRASHGLTRMQHGIGVGDCDPLTTLLDLACRHHPGTTAPWSAPSTRAASRVETGIHSKP